MALLYTLLKGGIMASITFSTARTPISKKLLHALKKELTLTLTETT